MIAGRQKALPFPEQAGARVAVQYRQIKPRRSGLTCNFLDMRQKANPVAATLRPRPQQHQPKIGIAGLWKTKGQFGNAR